MIHNNVKRDTLEDEPVPPQEGRKERLKRVYSEVTTEGTGNVHFIIEVGYECKCRGRFGGVDEIKRNRE